MLIVWEKKLFNQTHIQIKEILGTFPVFSFIANSDSLKIVLKLDRLVVSLRPGSDTELMGSVPEGSRLDSVWLVN